MPSQVQHVREHVTQIGERGEGEPVCVPLEQCREILAFGVVAYIRVVVLRATPRGTRCAGAAVHRTPAGSPVIPLRRLVESLRLKIYQASYLPLSLFLRPNTAALHSSSLYLGVAPRSTAGLAPSRCGLGRESEEDGAK